MNVFTSLFFCSHSERRGITFLIIILSLIYFTILIFYKTPIHKKESAKICAVIQSEKIKQENYIKELDFKFDPNTATYDELKKTGLNKYQATQIINYRKSGGHFYKPDDLKKIYSINDADYNRLENYISIKAVEKESKQKRNSKKPYPEKTIASVIPMNININTADTILLQKLPKIGSVRAKQIIKYRNLLGGFTRKEQIMEVYTIDTSIYAAIESNIYVDTLEIVKIDLNHSNYSELLKHPYINKYDAKNIIKYREIVKSIKNKRELIENSVVAKETFYKIEKYLSVK